jgi:hypothetical protein
MTQLHSEGHKVRQEGGAASFEVKRYSRRGRYRSKMAARQAARKIQQSTIETQAEAPVQPQQDWKAKEYQIRCRQAAHDAQRNARELAALKCQTALQDQISAAENRIREQEAWQPAPPRLGEPPDRAEEARQRAIREDKILLRQLKAQLSHRQLEAHGRGRRTR